MPVTITDMGSPSPAVKRRVTPLSATRRAGDLASLVRQV